MLGLLSAAAATSPLARGFEKKNGKVTCGCDIAAYALVVSLLKALERRMVYFTSGLKFIAWCLGANGYSPAVFILMSMKRKSLIARLLCRLVTIVARFRLLCKSATVARKATTLQTKDKKSPNLNNLCCPGCKDFWDGSAALQTDCGEKWWDCYLMQQISFSIDSTNRFSNDDGDNV